MNAAVPDVREASRGARGGALPYAVDGLIFVGGALIAVFFALLVRDSTIIDGVYLPRGNDSFYHARRILDAAIGSRGFYQFDDRLHVPDGAWIPWPWAYDWLMAKATQVALWIDPTLDPMAFISYVPVAWIFVNAALFLAMARAIGLSRQMQLLAMLCFALSPLTQLLHSIGMVDHHYIELTFVLLNAWLGLRWLERPADVAARDRARSGARRRARVSQRPVHSSARPADRRVRAVAARHGSAAGCTARFAIALLVVTQLVLLPSQPYREGMFEFGLLSWFHFYVAVCTAAAIVFMAWRPFTRASLGWLIALCAALMIPLSAQFIGGAGFLTGEFSILDTDRRGPEPLQALHGYVGAGRDGRAGTAGCCCSLRFCSSITSFASGARIDRSACTTPSQ